MWRNKTRKNSKQTRNKLEKTRMSLTQKCNSFCRAWKNNGFCKMKLTKRGEEMNKYLDSLHKKILASDFASQVSENEIMALVQAKAIESEHLVKESGDLVKDLVKDAISRQAVIDYLYTNMPWYDENGSIADDSQKLRDITNLVNGIPPVTPTQRWIPVSEGLPESNIAVLTYIDTGATKTYCLAYWDGIVGGWAEWTSYDLLKNREYEVLAWQPLPKPYKAEMEVRKNADSN